MRHHQRRAVLADRVQRVLDVPLRLRVQGGGGLVQKDNQGRLQQGPTANKRSSSQVPLLPPPPAPRLLTWQWPLSASPLRTT